MTRLEAFRERYRNLQSQASTDLPTHWIITHNAKFAALIGNLRKEIDELINSTGVERNVNLAMRRDIRALGWHPLFDRPKATSDGSKLQLIKEVCSTEYPEYAAEAKEALAHLAKEWQDSYQEAVTKLASGPPPPNGAGSAIKLPGRPSIFQQIRSSLRKPKPAGDSLTGHEPASSAAQTGGSLTSTEITSPM
jgi:hypothetical protein